MFTSALASLLGSLVFWDEIQHHFKNAMASETYEIIPGSGYGVPSQWLYILGNNVTQLLCIKGVYALSTRYSALTVNVTLSVRKFFTVLISIVYFQNPWTDLHSLSCAF